MYRTQSSPKRNLINLAYLGVKLKKTLAITREASSEIYLSQYFKPKIWGRYDCEAKVVSVQELFHVF